MSEEWFVPAPWQFVMRRGKRWIVRGDAPEIQIACVDVILTYHVADANAHLIAAAPDLYDALYLCMQTLDQYADISSTNEECPNAAMTAMMRAKTVLAKARGEKT